MLAPHQSIVLSTFSKVAPARRERKKRHFLFAKLFLLGLFPQKKKRYKRQTIFRYQDFLAAFLSQNRRKEKLTKETPCQGLRRQPPKLRILASGNPYAPLNRATARGEPLLKKWTKQSLSLCEQSAKQIKI